MCIHCIFLLWHSKSGPGSTLYQYGFCELAQRQAVLMRIEENNDYVPKDKIIRHTDSFLKLMSVLTQDNKYVEMGRELFHGKDGFNMCEVLDKAEARGEARGALNNTVEILRVIIAKNSWSKEQAMKFIGIPKSEFAKYAALL